jgi:hypothetical protein
MKIKFNRQRTQFLGLACALTATIALGSTALRAQTSPQNLGSSIQPAERVIAQSGFKVSYIGNFVKAEAPTSGTARIVSNGQHQFLEIDGAFQTTNQAPDLHVVLEPSATPPKSYSNPGQFINLGKLQKVSGAQRYPIPDSINVGSYKSVAIWCRMANATIGYAQFRSGASASR